MRGSRETYIPYCGECCFMVSEDANGYGGCSLKDYECVRCSDRCDLDHTAMRKDCVLRGLKYLQKWRRGKDCKMPLPYVVGKLIDASVYKLRNEIV